MTRAHYDLVAEDYERRTRAPFEGLVGQLDAFCAALAPGAQVADIGCGPGRDTALLRERGLRVLGLDLSVGMLNAGGLDGVAQADMRALAVRTNGLDGVWCHASLLHVPLRDVAGVLAEFARVIRASGELHLAVADGDGEGWESAPYDALRLRWFSHHREESLSGMLVEAGFTVHDVQRQSSHRDWLVMAATRTSASPRRTRSGPDRQVPRRAPGHPTIHVR